MFASWPALRAANRLRAATAFTRQGRSYSGLQSVIDKETGATQLSGFFETGFIVNNVQVEGAIFCLQDLWLMWGVRRPRDITPDALKLIEVVRPPLDILVVGCGNKMQQLPEETMRYLREQNVAVEVLSTRNALSYFNFLNQEGRNVGAALLPPGEDEPQPTDAAAPQA